MQPLSPPSLPSNPDARQAAIAKLKRAASTRTPSPSPFPSTSTSTSLSQPSSPTKHGLSSSLSHIAPPAPASTLERSTSLLARSLAMAKLTGEPIVNNQQLPPSLEALRARAGLKRYNTVTGVGVAFSDAAAAEEGGEQEQQPPMDRAAARVNLMRKLSSRRLVAGNGSSAIRGESHSRPREEGDVTMEEIRLPAPGLLSVVGRRGKQRPRSESMGDMDLWKNLGISADQDEVEEPMPTAPLNNETETERSWTSQSIRSSGHWAEERDRHSVIARTNGEEDAWELEDLVQKSPPKERHLEEEEAETIRDSQVVRPFGAAPTPTMTKTVDEDDMATPRPSSSWGRTNGRTGSSGGHNRSMSQNSGVFHAPVPLQEEDDDDAFAFSFNPGPAVVTSQPSIQLSASSPPPSKMDQATFANAQHSPPPRMDRLTSDTSTTSVSSLSPPTSPPRSALPSPPILIPSDPSYLRRSSIPTHLRTLPTQPPSHHQQNASFGIGAVEDYEVRRRGSSASSSVAFLEARNGPGRSSDGSLSQPHSRESRSQSQLSIGGSSGTNTPGENGRLMDFLGRKESFVPGENAEEILGAAKVTPLIPPPMERSDTEREEEEKAWEIKQERLLAKVERKREMAMSRAADKAGPFPPPEEGYTFPSPTVGSPRVSQDMARGVGSGNSGASGESDESFVIVNSPHDEPPAGLFGKRSPVLPSSPRFQNLASATSSSAPPLAIPGLASRRAESPIFNASYVPLSIPPALGGSPNLDRGQISPTATADPMNPMLMESAIDVSSEPMEKTHSTESGRRKWGFLSRDKGKGKEKEVGSPASPPPPTLVEPTSTKMGKSISVDSVTIPGSPAASNYSSSTEMRRNLSNDSADSFVLPPVRNQRLPEDQLPGSKILAKLESIIGTAELDPHSPSVLDNPPRRLLLHTPVLQVVNAQTVKDRHLFLFNDLLVIAKPIIEDHPETGEPIPSSIDNYFLTKSIVELQQLRLSSVEAPPEDSSRNSSKKHPLLVAFVDRFANDPKRAITSLIQKGNLTNDAPTIANLLFKNADLNRNQVGAYLSTPDHRHILSAFIQRFRFAGVRIDDALRIFLMTLRLPHTLRAAEYVLGVLAHQWTDVNTATGFDPSLTTSLVMAIMRLSDALHGPGEHGEDAMFGSLNPTMSVDDFIASFRECDPRLLVQEDLLNRIYNSVRRERIEQASDNSMFSMTPDIEATIEPTKLPSLLTYRNPSELITITIPAPDPKFYIKLHGTDLKFDPPTLTFAKSNTQSFRVTGTALGVRVMVLIKMGASAPRYQGLPLNKSFSIERAFMQHCFVLSFVNHLDVKRKYMFSTLDADVRSTWVRTLKEGISTSAKAPKPATKALQAGEAVAIQVLRDALIAPEAPVPTLPAPVVVPSPRPGTAVRFGTPVGPPPPRTRLGTPTRAGGALVRTNSFSRTYAAGVGKVEMDLVDRKTQNTNSQARRGSREDPQVTPFGKKGTDLQMVVEQNSLLPLVLSFLSAGTSAAPHPMSISGSAFQLPPLPRSATGTGTAGH